MERTYVASRWTRGNVLFPDILRLDDTGVVKVKRRWFGTTEESVAYHKVASVHLSSGILFATLRIETAGGGDSLEMRGLTRSAAREARGLIHDAQIHAGEMR